jgi:transcriptional regulator with XRE-family HTH domain
LPLSTDSLPAVFSELVKKARSKAGMTQEELAAKVHLTREYISLLERGKRMPTIHVFIRLSRALGLSPADLIVQVEASMPKKF